MAATVNSMKSVLRAHNEIVNGCRALGPDLDDATEILHQAHAVLVLAAEAADAGVVNDDIIRAGYRAAEQLLSDGIRNVIEGHRMLAGRITRQ